MKPLHRSLLGVLIALAGIPVFLALQACIPVFPVPVGDPEKSRIDPAITGVWLLEDEDYIYLFEPYDKRTWLVSGYDVLDEDREECASDDEAAAGDNGEISPYDALMDKIVARGPECFDLEGGIGVKSWQTRLGGEWFMTWQAVGAYDDELGFERDEYMVWRVDLSEPGELRLWMFDEGHDAWDELPIDDDEQPVTRRMVERVIRKNASDPGFYYEEPAVFYRVRPEHLGVIGELFRQSDYDPDW